MVIFSKKPRNNNTNNAKVGKIRRYTSNPRNNIVVINREEFEGGDIIRDSCKCNCGETLNVPKDHDDNETLYCQVCGTSYLYRQDHSSRRMCSLMFQQIEHTKRNQLLHLLLRQTTVKLE